MKKFAFILLSFIFVGCAAQSHHKKGVRIGSDGDTIKSIILRNDTIIFYINQDTIYLTLNGEDVRLGYTDEEIAALIASGYIPIGNAEDLKCIDTTYVTPRTFAAGTQWETTTTTTGLSDFYLQVEDLELDNDTLDALYGSTWYDNTVGWEGIGEFNTADFTGVYDGGNKFINNLYINAGSADSFIGLFDAVLNATIKNVRLDSVDITSTRTLIVYLGSLIGISRGDTIENILVTGTVDADGDRVGGLIGDNRTNQTFINKVSFVGDVIGNDGVGGIMGALTAGNYTLIANNLFSRGSVTGDENVGGLFGDLRFQNTDGGYDFIKNSYSATVVTGNTNTGGLAGNNASNHFFNCYYDTDISGQSDDGSMYDPSPQHTSAMKGATGYSQEIDDSIIYYGWSGYVWDFGTANDYPEFNDLPISGNAPDDFMSAWDKENENPLFEEIYSENELYPIGAILYEGIIDTAVYLLGKSGNQRLKAAISPDGFSDWDTIAASAIGEILNISDLPIIMGTATKFEYNTWRKIDSFYIFHGIRLNTGSYGVGYSTSDSIDDNYTIHDWLIDPDNNNLASTFSFTEVNQIHAPELIRVDNTYHWYGTGQFNDHWNTYFIWHGTSPVGDLLNITFDQVLYNGADTDFIFSKEAQILQTPRIYYSDGYYYMTLTIGGVTEIQNQRDIYVARSTTPTGFSLSNLQRTPIIVSNGSDTWNELRVYTHDILKKNDGYWVEPHLVNDSIRMYFSGHSLSGSGYTPQNTGIPGLARIKH